MTISKKTLVAAFRNPMDGHVSTGRTHGDAFANSSIKSVSAIREEDILSAEGFSLPDGSHFMTRAQAMIQFGVGCSEDL